MWGFDYKESWVQKNWCFWTVVLEKTLESPLDCKEIQPVHPEGNQSWVFIGRTDVETETPNTLATWCEEVTHLKRPWCWESLKVGGEGDNRGWDGWMASPNQWTWVWVDSGSWWWTGRPGVLRFMGLQRVGHNWATELNWTELLILTTAVVDRAWKLRFFSSCQDFAASTCIVSLQTSPEPSSMHRSPSWFTLGNPKVQGWRRMDVQREEPVQKCSRLSSFRWSSLGPGDGGNVPHQTCALPLWTTASWNSCWHSTEPASSVSASTWVGFLRKQFLRSLACNMFRKKWSWDGNLEKLWEGSWIGQRVSWAVLQSFPGGS